MPQPDAHAWWDDVQHVRAAIERKREAQARGVRRRTMEGRRTTDGASAGALDDDWMTPRPGRRFERAGQELRGRFARGGSDSEPAMDSRADDEVAQPLQVQGRRTVEITGRTVGAPAVPRLVRIDRRRPARRPLERVGPRPDRLALWAVVLGFFLIFVAVTSTSQAAVPAASDEAPALEQVVALPSGQSAPLRVRPPAR